MKSIALLLSGMLAATLLVLGLSAPAEAGPACNVAGQVVCGRVYHRTDSGYDKGIIITCKGALDSSGDFTSQGVSWEYQVYEGQASTRYCNDMDGIKVRSGEEVWCNYPTRFDSVNMQKTFDAPGWHKTGDFWDKSCEVRLD